MNVLLNIYYLFVIVTLFSLIIKSSLITLPLSNESGFYFLNLNLGTPEQSIKLLVDIISNSTWIAGSKCSWFYGYVADKIPMFDEKNSTSLIISNVSLTSRKEMSRFRAEGNLSSDYFTIIQGLRKLNCNFILANYFLSDVPSNGVIGFDKSDNLNNSNPTNFMFIDKLFEKGEITNKIFYINNTNYPTLNIGEYPNNMNNFSNYSTCTNQNLTFDNVFKLNQNDRINSHWMCKLSQIYIGNFTQFTSIISDKLLLFSSTISGMLMSSDYVTFFEKNYFSGMNYQNCFQKDFGNTICFVCLKNYNLNLFPILNLEINDWVYSFSPDNLFDYNPPKDFYYETSSSPSNEENDNNFVYFKIRFVNKKKYMLNHMVIGIQMFDDIVVFDNEKNELGFFTSSKIEKKYIVLPLPGLSLVILLVIIIVSFFAFVLIMVIGYVCRLHFKNRNKREYQLEDLSKEIDYSQESKQL